MDKNIMCQNNGNNCIIFKIGDSSSSIYERTRRCWILDMEKAQQVDYVLSVIKGKIVGVFKPQKWYYVCNDDECNKKKCKDWPCKRKGFIGVEADNDIKIKYLDKNIPKELLGQANPVKYIKIYKAKIQQRIICHHLSGARYEGFIATGGGAGTYVRAGGQVIDA
jgi:hypothetical protein